MYYHTNLANEYFTHERCFITEIMNTVDHPDLSIARARVLQGVTTQLHAVSVEEHYYILSGSGLAEVDGTTYEVYPGDVVAIPAGAAQRITNMGDTDLIFLCICQPRFVPECYTNLDAPKN